MKLEVGMYVRTKYGIKRITDIICGQDIRFDNVDGFDEDLLNYHDYDGISKNSNTWKEIVIGEPKEKIIELIEVGDYVNELPVEGYYTRYDEEKDDYIKIGIVTLEDYWKGTFTSVEDIKSIVTKETFESMEYKLGDK